MRKATVLIFLSFSALLIVTCTSRPATTAPATRTPIVLAPVVTEMPGTPAQPRGTRTPIPTAPATPLGYVLVPDNLSAGDPYSPELGNRGYDVQTYTLKLAVDPATMVIDGEVLVEARSTMDNLQQISLDLIGLNIAGVVVGANSAPFFRQDTKLVVDLPRPIAQGAPLSLTVTYSGTPVRQSSRYIPFVAETGMFFVPPNLLYVASEPDGARYWYPVNDHPRDKAAYRFELVVPTGFTGVANGVLVTSTTDGSDSFPDGRAGDLYVWELNSPCASAFVSIVVGQFEPVEGTSPAGVPLRSYVFPSLKAQFESAIDIGAALDWMSQLFGPYPYATYGYVTVSGYNDALENETMVLLGDSSFVNETIMSHEMVHMWFGDWVSLDTWAQIWRSEGFATYISLLWVNRNSPGVVQQTVDLWAQQIAASPSGYPMDNPPPGEMFGRDTYHKGAVFVHQLRLAMGDDAFFQGVRTYIQRYGGGNATDADFQAVMEEAAGKSLEDLFVQWVR